MWCLKLITSFWLASVMILLDYGLATGNKCWRAVLTLYPNWVLKLWKIKWGYISGIVCSLSLTSCLKTTFCSPKYKVGPTGKWLIISPSGCPLCSCSNTRSVTPFLKPSSVSSERTVPPLLILLAFGRRIHSYLANWSSLLVGSREVVIKSWGSE